MLVPATLTPLSSFLRCLREPHLLLLPLTPVGLEGPDQPRLFVPGNNTWMELVGSLGSGVEGRGEFTRLPT